MVDVLAGHSSSPKSLQSYTYEFMIQEVIQERTMRKFTRGAVAFLLSAFVPGLGQIFNGQMLLGPVLFALYGLWVFSAGMFHLLYSFLSAIFYAVVLWIFVLTVAIHATLVAIGQVKSDSAPRQG